MNGGGDETSVAAREADLARLRGEFLAMPGLRLTAQQAARLLDVRVEESKALLSNLEDEGFLICVSDGGYRRAFPLMA